MSRVGRPTGTDRWPPGAGGRGNGDCLVGEHRPSFRANPDVLEVTGDGCTTETHQIVHFQGVNFMVREFTSIKMIKKEVISSCF